MVTVVPWPAACTAQLQCQYTDHRVCLPQMSPSRGGPGPYLTHGSRKSTIQNSILIGSAVSAGLTNVFNMHTRPHLRHTQQQALVSRTIQNQNTPKKPPTHDCLMAFCPGLSRWAGTTKIKPIWILPEQETVSGSGIGLAICKSAPRSRQITTSAPHYSVFHGCPSCCPTNSVGWQE